jgi:hypothetical protein
VEWHGNIASYEAAVALANEPPTLAIWARPQNFLASANGSISGIDGTHALRNTWGLGLHMEHEITKNIAAFSRIGWNCGPNEPWMFNDANCTGTSSARPSSRAAFQKRKGCGAHRQMSRELFRAALRFARIPQKLTKNTWRPAVSASSLSTKIAPQSPPSSLSACVLSTQGRSTAFYCWRCMAIGSLTQ